MKYSLLSFLVPSRVLLFFFQKWPVTGVAGLVKLQVRVAEVWLVTSFELTRITGPAKGTHQKQTNKNYSVELMGHLNESAS